MKNKQYPVAERAIAQIRGGEIEVAPSSNNDIKLNYYAFPVDQRPIARIADGQIEVRPENNNAVELKYLAYPVEKRPIARIGDGKIQVEPASLSSIKLEYYRFPVPERPIGRILNNTIQVEWDKLILAHGSSPLEIPGFPFDGKTVVSSSDALNFQDIPKHLLIVGGGVVGCEFACIFNSLGAKVTLLKLRTDFCLLTYWMKVVQKSFTGK